MYSLTANTRVWWTFPPINSVLRTSLIPCLTFQSNLIEACLPPTLHPSPSTMAPWGNWHFSPVWAPFHQSGCLQLFALIICYTKKNLNSVMEIQQNCKQFHQKSGTNLEIPSGFWMESIFEYVWQKLFIWIQRVFVWGVGGFV